MDKLLCPVYYMIGLLQVAAPYYRAAVTHACPVPDGSPLREAVAAQSATLDDAQITNVPAPCQQLYPQKMAEGETPSLPGETLIPILTQIANDIAVMS